MSSSSFGNILENLFEYIKSIPFKLKSTAPSQPPQSQPRPLILERLIEAGGTEEKTLPIYVGIVGGDQQQVIRIGEYPKPVHALKSLVRDNNTLKYEFEDDISLVFRKQSGGALAYTLTAPALVQDSVMSIPYKKISMASEELDAIGDLK